MNNEETRKLLREWRRLSKQGQFSAAERLGVSYDRYCHWERKNGGALPDEIREKVAAWIKSPPHYGYEKEAFVGRGLARKFGVVGPNGVVLPRR